MSLIVNTNVGSLNAQRSLAASGAELKTAMERLSSGKKINSAADDAAGFAIAERMTAQIRGLNMATKNTNDGLSMLAVIENATNDVTDMLHRMRELAVQAANDTNGLQDRTFLQKEVAALVEEIDRVATQTQYNNQLVLNGSFNNKNIQVGTEAGQTVSLSIGSVKSADLGQGEFIASVEGLDFAGILETTWSITIDGKTTNVVFDAASGNGIVDVDDVIGSAVSGVRVTYIDGGPNFRLVATGAKSLEVSITDTNGVQSKSSNGALWDLQDTGVVVDSFAYDAGSSASDPKLTNIFDAQAGGPLADISVGDWVAFGNDSSRYYEVRAKVTGGNSVAGIQVDGGPDLNDGNLVGSSISVVEYRTLANVDLKQNPSDALDIVTGAIDMVSSLRAEYGALQNRLEYTVSNLMNVAEFTTSARSRIEDADFAAESARLAKAQVLQQTGTAMLAQANAQPQLVLSLIQ